MTNWPVKTLGDVCELSTGGTPSTGNKSYYNGGQIKWLRSGDVHQREIHDCDGRITEEGMRNANTRFLPLNSVLIALAGQGKTRGTVAMLRTKATCNQSVVSIAPVDTEKLLPEFIFWNLHMKYDEIRRMTGDDGNDRRGLNMRLIRSMTVPIAPLEEQKRIVALLDAATARVVELTACYEQARTHANNLFTSALSSALEDNPDWPTKTLDEFFDSKPKSSESLRQKDYLSSGKFPVVDQGQELIGGFTNDQQLVRDFEIPVIVFGDHTRCVKYVDFPFASGADGTKILVPRKGVDPKYAYFQLLSIELPTKGYARHFAELSKRSFVLPPLEEQKQIVVRLDSIRTKTSAMVAAYDAKLTAAKNLRQSILEAAFAGDL